MRRAIRRVCEGSLLGWLDLEVQLQLMGERPEWAEVAASQTLIRLAPRLGWPRPVEAWAEVVSWRGSSGRKLGQAARLRWRHEVELAQLEADEPVRRTMGHWWPERRDMVPRVVGYLPNREPVLLWGDHVIGDYLIVPFYCSVLTPDEREALGIVAAVLGAPA